MLCESLLCQKYTGASVLRFTLNDRLSFDRIVRTILEPSAGKIGRGTLSATKTSNQRTLERWSFWIDRSIHHVARLEQATEVGQVRARGRLCGKPPSSFRSRRARRRDRQHTGQLSAPPVATAIDRDNKTEQHVLRRRPRDRHARRPHEIGPPKRHISRQVAVPDGLGYFVFLLMRRNSSCRQLLAVAAPAAIAHPKRDVNIHLRISARIHHPPRGATARVARGGLTRCEYRVLVPGTGYQVPGPRVVGRASL